MEDKFDLRVRVNSKLQKGIIEYCKYYEVTKAHLVRIALKRYLIDRGIYK